MSVFRTSGAGQHIAELLFAADDASGGDHAFFVDQKGERSREGFVLFRDFQAFLDEHRETELELSGPLPGGFAIAFVRHEYLEVASAVGRIANPSYQPV